jgi:hypothetical protein
MNDKPPPLDVANLKAQRQAIRALTRAKMLPVEEFTQPAVAFLEQDLADLTLEPISVQNPDIFVLRANQIGVELFERKAYHYAVILFGELLAKAEEFVKTTGRPRQLGAIKVNLGAALIQAGNFDAGVNILLEAAMDEGVTSGTGSTNAERLLRGYVLDEVSSHIALLCTQQFEQATGFPLGPESVLTMANHTNPLGAATLVSIIPLMQHPEWQKRASTHFGRVRILDGLRWLSAMLETLVRHIGRNSVVATIKSNFRSQDRATLQALYQTLFVGQAWWSAAQQWRTKHPGQTDILASDTDSDIVAKWQSLAALPESSRSELLTKVCLTSGFTRNLAAHYLELPTGWTAELVQDVIKYQFLAQLLVFDWARRDGHFVTLMAPGVWPK